jgi:serine/threonine protein phosphatase PrpC
MSLFKNKYLSIYRDIELEAFYDIGLKERKKIIIAHMMIHLFPLLLVGGYFWQYADFQFAKIAIGTGVVFYIAVIAETITYLFPSSRRFYKENIYWFFIPFTIICGISGYFVGRELMTMNIELNRDLLQGVSNISAAVFFITAAFVWAHIGLSHIFKASRAIFKRKAAIEADMRFATEVQNRILKDITVEQNGTRAYACSLPANELGGDYFELAIHDDQLFASVGDISGHSFGAGLLMSMTKSALQTHLEYNKDPSRIFSALNSMMMKQTDRAMYATMTMLKLNLSEQEAVLCNAGHLPVIQIQNRDGELIHRHRKGIGLGISGSAEYSNMEFPVNKDDLLILYSDGLVETRDEKMQIRDSGYFENIVKNVISSGNRSPEDIASEIMARVKESDHSKEMEDDSSIIVINV